MGKYLLINFFFNFAIASEKSSRRSAFYGYEPDVTCNQNDLNLKSESLIQCSVLCKTNALCRYFRYDGNSKNCTGCHAAFIPVSSTEGEIPEGYYALLESHPGPMITTAASTTPISKAPDSLTSTGILSTASTSEMSSPRRTITPTNPPTTTKATTTSALSTVVPKITSPLFDHRSLLTPDVGHHTSERTIQDQGNGGNTSFGQSKYMYMFTEAMNFTAAQVTCNNETARFLALVETESENMLIAELLRAYFQTLLSENKPKAPLAYIGAQINSHQNVVYFPSEEKINIPYVLESYPTTTGSTWCIAMESSGIWHSIRCNTTIPGICEKQRNG